VKAGMQSYAMKIDALSQRERVVVFIALIAVIFYVMNVFLLEPVLSRKKMLETGIAQQRSEIQAIKTQIAALESRQVDPDAANLARRNSITEQLAEIDGSLKSMSQKLVPAQNMKSLLQDMLSHQPRLQLLALRTLPVAPLVEKPAKTPEKGDVAAPVAKAATTDSLVFKHGVEITLQGSYADLYEYLTRAEKSQWRMYWSRASLNAEDFPRLKLTVTIYTLSLDKAWLVV